jgi:hypothetical protein
MIMFDAYQDDAMLTAYLTIQKDCPANPATYLENSDDVFGFLNPVGVAVMAMAFWFIVGSAWFGLPYLLAP